MLAFLLAFTITFNNDLDRISDNLDLIYENAIKGREIETQLKGVESELKYFTHKLDLNSLEGRTQATIVDLYLLSIIQLRDYLKTDYLPTYKNSIGNKIYADSMLYNLIQDENKKRNKKIR